MTSIEKIKVEKENNSRNQTHIDNHFKAWEMIASTDKIQKLVTKMGKQGSIGNVKVEKTMHVCFPC